jgi:hypothetical protein
MWHAKFDDYGGNECAANNSDTERSFDWQWEPSRLHHFHLGIVALVDFRKHDYTSQHNFVGR